MFRSVRFYSVSSPWPDSEQELSEKLHNTVFRPCGAYTEMSSGFEPPSDEPSPSVKFSMMSFSVYLP